MRVTAATSVRKDIVFTGRLSSRIGSNNIDSARNTLARLGVQRECDSPVANCNALFT